jgi:hypothetical protein
MKYLFHGVSYLTGFVEQCCVTGCNLTCGYAQNKNRICLQLKELLPVAHTRTGIRRRSKFLTVRKRKRLNFLFFLSLTYDVENIYLTKRC